MHNFMLAHDSGFAWSEEERGSFRTDLFPPVDFPVVPIPHGWSVTSLSLQEYMKTYVPLFRKSLWLASMSRRTHLIGPSGFAS
jgi:hypothetical protein